jgi:hypothetical protein
MPNYTHLTSAVIKSIPIKTGIDIGTADVTYSNKDIKDVMVLKFATGHATNAVILPKITGRLFVVINGAVAAANLKVASGTAVVVAAGKTAIIMCDGTNYVRITPDA